MIGRGVRQPRARAQARRGADAPTDREGAMSQSTPAEPSDLQVRRLLVALAAAMVATGQPVSDIEDEVVEVAGRLGFPDAQVAAGPTGVTVCVGSGEPSTYESVKGSLRLDQAAEVRTIRYQLSRARSASSRAISALLALQRPPAALPGVAGQPRLGGHRDGHRADPAAGARQRGLRRPGRGRRRRAVPAEPAVPAHQHAAADAGRLRAGLPGLRGRGRRAARGAAADAAAAAGRAAARRAHRHGDVGAGRRRHGGRDRAAGLRRRPAAAVHPRDRRRGPAVQHPGRRP